jgi:hypothetical protein
MIIWVRQGGCKDYDESDFGRQFLGLHVLLVSRQHIGKSRNGKDGSRDISAE